MRFVLIFSLLVFTLSTFADTVISTQIHDVDIGQVNDEPLVFLATGQVVTFPTNDKAMLNRLIDAAKSKTWFLITLNKKKEIINLIEIPVQQSITNFKIRIKDSTPYLPSILKNLDHARSFFSEARTNPREESQCFNRAHVWAYEWRIKNNLYSSKVWLFFTRQFIRKYKFDWWFHVAPMVHVVVNNEVKERVMDIKYAKGPIRLKLWTDIFMRDNADCPVVQKYSEQANHPESGSCFIMKSSMYYYQPVDLEQLELIGLDKSKWLESDVKQAYLDAFDVTL